ncbi:MAG: TetR/AcrR family transcriptional regulator [Erysipelotrichaceae bacterium]|nr:TetR/AcrR family transcriptional regulator [Erysipelotrichaceae bacterium]MDY6034389.1 TetR/AcrR family transcriptional regulator [Bulleidia sp.]
MGKLADNKEKKERSLLDSAYELFLNKGFENTVVSDIVMKAGVAKGTFYLYFKDKHQIRDVLIARTAEKFFLEALHALDQKMVKDFSDQLIFIVDYIIDIMKNNPLLLRFVAKNLSWGIYQKAINHSNTGDKTAYSLFLELVNSHKELKIEALDTMLFLIIELASSTSYRTILDNDPMTYEELKPYLNRSIRAIVKLHTIS